MGESNLVVDSVHKTKSKTMVQHDIVSDTSSNALVAGTMVYVILAVLGCAGTGVYFRTCRLSHDKFGLACYMITTATICMWMMWIFTWLAQWHPQITPGPYETAGDSSNTTRSPTEMPVVPTGL